MKTLAERRTIGRFDFEFVDDRYECRGEMVYDYEHDEIPEPALWAAASLLETQLKNEGHVVCKSHSEKGWVEVCIKNMK